MTNLLAVLLSLAMMFTGAAAPVSQPVSRTMQVSNITVRHNDEEVALSPYASLGVMTDGAQVALDFFIGIGDEVYLPFQAAADENGLLVYSGNADVTLKLDDMLDSLMDGQSENMLALASDYIAVYDEMFRLMDDPVQMDAIQREADAIYDEMVDRGAGVADKLVYEGETYDVKTYEYDLDGAQLGRLADAVMASNETLAKYAETYFRLLKSLPEESGIHGADSYEALMGQLEGFGMTMHVTESIAEGLNISDSIIHMNMEGLEKPFEMVVHAVKDADGKTSQATGQIADDSVTMDIYVEGVQSGSDMQMSMSMAVNPVGGAQESGEIFEDYAEQAAKLLDAEPEEAEEAEADAAENDEEEEDDVVDGESDSEDAIFITVDFDRNYDETDKSVAQSLSYGLDVAENKLHAEYSIEGTLSEAGLGAYQSSGELDIGDESFGIDFTVNIVDDPIEVRADADKAVGLDEFDPSALVAAATADAAKLMADESVQKLTAMAQSAMEALAAIEPAEIVEEVVDMGAEDQPQGEMTFANPQFNWLPEGYAVESMNVDETYQDVNCTLTNAATGESIYIDIYASNAGSTFNHYAIKDDGSYERIDGVVLTEEVNNGYSVYNCDDGTLYISVFPGESKVSAEDVIRMLTNISF